MPRVKTESLQEGMVVASDVKNMDGMLLIPSGCSLTERQIDILQAWGLAEIEVQATEGGAADADPLATLTPDVVAKMTAELKALFWKPDEANPVFAEVLKLILQRRARRSHVKP
jgi:hypothetical protein